MSFRITFSRALGVGAVAAALATGAAMASETPQGLKADGLRWEAIANAYHQKQNSSNYTQQGLKADGLRLQGLAQSYAWLKSRPAASFSTPEGLRADGLRWQAIARAYAQPRVSTISASEGFNWVDAGIVAASGFGLAACAAGLIGVSRFGTRRSAV